MPETGHYGEVGRLGRYSVKKSQGNIWDFYTLCGPDMYRWSTDTVDHLGGGTVHRRADGVPKQAWEDIPKETCPGYVNRYMSRLCERFNRGEYI